MVGAVIEIHRKNYGITESGVINSAWRILEGFKVWVILELGLQIEYRGLETGKHFVERGNKINKD